MHILLVLYALLGQFLCGSSVHRYQHLKDNIRSTKHGPLTTHADSEDKGYMMCAGNHMIPDVLKMIWQLKHQWKSKMGIAVAHCGEITEENQEVLQLMHPGVRVLNLCVGKSIFGMSQQQAHIRLRGFYCKVAAVIESPFPETMVLDLDVVWFSSPDNLFNNKAYRGTGALFFRDRTYLADAKHKSDDQFLLELFQTHGVGQSNDDIKHLAHNSGLSFYWLFEASKIPDGKPFPEVGDLQDSSVVLINRSQHPKLLSVLGDLLPSFDYGDGDQEIFWIAATVARENFTFSPFLAGQYGDCHGVVLHYHPDDASSPKDARPLFANAAYLVEKELFIVGEFLGAQVTDPVLASTELTINNVSMHTVLAGTKRGDAGCTCQFHACSEVPGVVSRQLLHAQWLSLTMRLSREGPSKDCVPVLIKFVSGLDAALQAQIELADCFFAGCPQFPVTIEVTAPWPSGKYCEPVHFLDTPPPELAALAQEARRSNSAFNLPPVKNNTPIQCAIDRQLFLYIDETIRPFNSWAAFVGRGFDTDNVVRLTRAQCDNIPRGESIQ